MLSGQRVDGSEWCWGKYSSYWEQYYVHVLVGRVFSFFTMGSGETVESINETKTRKCLQNFHLIFFLLFSLHASSNKSHSLLPNRKRGFSDATKFVDWFDLHKISDCYVVLFFPILSPPQLLFSMFCYLVPILLSSEEVALMSPRLKASIFCRGKWFPLTYLLYPLRGSSWYCIPKPLSIQSVNTLPPPQRDSIIEYQTETFTTEWMNQWIHQKWCVHYYYRFVSPIYLCSINVAFHVTYSSLPNNRVVSNMPWEAVERTTVWDKIIHELWILVERKEILSLIS